MIKSLTACKYAESTLSERYVFAGGDKEKALPISFTVYLIEADDRKILVDAGCDTMPGFDMKHFVSPAFVLEAHGVSPLSITDVFLTHAHHDHIEAVKHFKNATVHVEAFEYESSKKHGYIPEGFRLNVFEDVSEVCGVRIKKIAGHSKGSCIVEFSRGGKNYVICGDECYSRRCLTEKIVTGSTVNPENSKKFIEKYGTEEYITLLCHDPEILPGQNGALKIF